MKKAAFAIALPLVLLLIATHWSSEAVNSPQKPNLSQTSGLSVSEMVDQSDLIAIGSCVDTRSVWVDRALVTVATISVSETLKGAKSGTVTVALPGGIDANRKIPIAMTYAGAPRITPGEDVFLFLANDESVGTYTVTGYSQGKFSIARDDAGEKFVTRDHTRTTPLSNLKAQVKAHLRQR